MLKSLPWWLKILFKISASVLPVSYERLRQIVTGYSGAMTSIDYAEKTFLAHYAEFSKHGMKPGSFFELGPGGSLVSGVMAISHGFEKAILIDVGDFASKDVELYKSIFRKYLPSRLDTFLDKYKSTNNVAEALKSCGIHYETEGLNSLKKLDSDIVVFSFSNAVLEHVKADEFSETMMQLKRVHKLNSISSHRIDFKDHLGGSLNNLRFSKNIWESKYFPNSGFYTNRLRYSDVKNICVDVGYLVVSEKLEKWDQLPLKVKKMSREFWNYNEADLIISAADLILKKVILK